jgi:hypothetical protein
MVQAVLADAETFAVALPRPVDDALEWFDDRAAVLDEVTTPVLVAFLDGYRGAGGAVTFDVTARQRLSLYRAYLYLIMWVETAPRGFGRKLLDRIYDRVFQPLAAALGKE